MVTYGQISKKAAKLLLERRKPLKRKDYAKKDRWVLDLFEGV